MSTTLTRTAEPERMRNAIVGAALTDLTTLKDLLNHPFDSDEQRETILARIQIAQVAMALPAASMGSCAFDGTPLTFRGRKDGLFVCCNNDPEHCWKNSKT